MVGKRAWQVPADAFAAAWNGSRTLGEAAARLAELAGGPVPRWAALARAGQLRGEGVGLKVLAPEPLKAGA